MIRAAALSYAIVFSLLVGLICSGILFIAATQKRIEVIHNNKERVLFDSYAAIQLGMRSLAIGDSVMIIHGNADTSKIRHIRWGAFSLVSCQTYKFPHIRKRAALIGLIQAPLLPCLYLPGTSELKITGETRIEGTAFVPNGRLERAYIAGKTYAFDQLIFGTAKTSETSLPALKPEWKDLTAATFIGTHVPQPFPGKDSAYSFQQPTAYIQSLQPIVIGNRLSGNVIIHSFDSIFVEARASLNNVILIAPVVRFEAGLRGTVQVLAHERIICEHDVQLLYPSVCVLNELVQHSERSNRSIILEEHAMVLGGILITSQQVDFRKMPVLEIRKDAVVAGLVYVSGETELQGSIMGSIYTQQLIAREGGGVYGNHLVDATISQVKLPAAFLLPDWLMEQSKVKSKIIAWL